MAIACTHKQPQLSQGPHQLYSWPLAVTAMLCFHPLSSSTTRSSLSACSGMGGSRAAAPGQARHASSVAPLPAQEQQGGHGRQPAAGPTLARLAPWAAAAPHPHAGRRHHNLLVVAHAALPKLRAARVRAAEQMRHSRESRDGGRSTGRQAGAQAVDWPSPLLPLAPCSSQRPTAGPRRPPPACAASRQPPAQP